MIKILGGPSPTETTKLTVASARGLLRLISLRPGTALDARLTHWAYVSYGLLDRGIRVHDDFSG